MKLIFETHTSLTLKRQVMPWKQFSPIERIHGVEGVGVEWSVGLKREIQ